MNTATSMARLTVEDVQPVLERLREELPRDECRTCDCLQGFLTQLELDADDDTQAKLASAMRAALLGQLLTSGKLDAARRIYASLLAADGENVELLASAS